MNITYTEKSGRDDSRSGITEAGRSDFGSVGDEKEKLPNEPQKSAVLRTVDFLQFDRTSVSDRAERTGDDERIESYRGTENERSNEMDTDDEQHQTVSERDSDGGTDLQLEYHVRDAEADVFHFLD